MPRRQSIGIQLTKSEAVAVSRLLQVGIAAIRSEPSEVSNPVTLQRAINHADLVTAKIKLALAGAGIHES